MYVYNSNTDSICIGQSTYGFLWYLFNNPKVKVDQGMLDVVLCSLNT